ncbi:MAG: hypothetical protein JWR85_975 [Marmoricola sp.]|nr:hypothetical protein [Marmoricola sp.]
MSVRPTLLDPAFLITRDGDVDVFKTPEEAADWVEAVEVLDGEYTDCFRVDGQKIVQVVDGDTVRLG